MNFRLPNTIVCDGGPEMDNKVVARYLKNKGVKQIISRSNHKASTIERFQLTIQRYIYNHITQKETLSYVDILQDFIRNYNNTPHTFTKLSPYDVEKSQNNQNKVLQLNLGKFEKHYNKRRKAKYKSGDIVRISLSRTAFHRGYNLQRTMERFIIVNVKHTYPYPIYTIKDELNRPINGSFLETELTRVNLERYRASIIDERSTKKGLKQKLRFKGFVFTIKTIKKCILKSMFLDTPPTSIYGKHLIRQMLLG